MIICEGTDGAGGGGENESDEMPDADRRFRSGGPGSIRHATGRSSFLFRPEHVGARGRRRSGRQVCPPAPRTHRQVLPNVVGAYPRYRCQCPQKGHQGNLTFMHFYHRFFYLLFISLSFFEVILNFPNLIHFHYFFTYFILNESKLLLKLQLFE